MVFPVRFAIRASGDSEPCFLAYRGCSSGIARERGKISTPVAQNKSRTPLHSGPLCVLPLSHSEGKQCSSRKLQAIGLHSSVCCQTLPPSWSGLTIRKHSHSPSRPQSLILSQFSAIHETLFSFCGVSPRFSYTN